MVSTLFGDELVVAAGCDAYLSPFIHIIFLLDF